MQTELSYVLSLGMERNSLCLKVCCPGLGNDKGKHWFYLFFEVNQFIILDRFKIACLTIFQVAPRGNLGYWSSTVFPITEIVLISI